MANERYYCKNCNQLETALEIACEEMAVIRIKEEDNKNK
jgi:hypothetical protein